MLGAINAANIFRRWGFSLRPRGQRSGGGTSTGLNSSGQQLEVQTKCGKCVYTRQHYKSSNAQPSNQDLHHINHLYQPSSTDHPSSEYYPGQQNFPLECLNERRKRKAAQLKKRREENEALNDQDQGFKVKLCPHKRKKRKKDGDGTSIDRSGSCSLSNNSIRRYIVVDLNLIK